MATNRSRIIGVAGTLGAGKSTVVDALCRRLGWDRCPSRSPDPAYVAKIHDDPQRWSFEAQLNFLVLKASGLREAMLAGEDIVVDRSIYEDRDIMARSWAEEYWDERARKTYEDCAKNLTADLPAPDVILLCRCSRTELERRLHERNFEKKHPAYNQNWLARLEDLYEEWAKEFALCPLLELDTESYDVRQPRVIDAVIRDIELYLAPKPADQTLLFDLTGESPTVPLFEPEGRPTMQVLRPLNSVSVDGVGAFQSLRLESSLAGSIEHPAIYIAAPFSAYANEPEPLSEELRLPVDLREHGVLSAQYRSVLEKTGTALKRKGLNPFLPHRDINAWGTRVLSPSEAVEGCLQAVLMCDGLLAVPGSSFGVHAESGVALAAGKPSVFVEVEELDTSFFGRGFIESTGVQRLRVRSLADLPKAIERSDIFLNLSG